MPKAKYPEELQDPAKFNKKFLEWVELRNSQVGEIIPWDLEQDATWRWSNRLVTEDLIRHFCNAYGETNPLYRSVDYARKTRYGGIIAPPNFITCIAPSAIGQEPDELPCTGFNGGASYEWFKLARPGDEFHGYDTWLGFEEKKRPEGYPRMFIQTVKRTYINQREEIVANIYGTELRFALAPTEEGLLYGQTGPSIQKLEPWTYTEEDHEEITRTYEEMEKNRRGAEIRWWEDVTVGEDIGTVLQGPYDLMDVMSFMGVQSYLSLAFGIKWKRVWNHTRFTFNKYGQLAWEPHLRDHEGLGYIFNQSAQSEAGVSHLICNWMGDDGFLKKMSCQAQRMMPVGDCNWIRGKVVKKYVEDGEHVVDLEITSTTQRGIMHMPATATVRLLSREAMRSA